MQVNMAEAMVLTKVLKKFGIIDLPAKGTSMYPFIIEGDICSFTVCKPTELKKGDICLFILGNGKLVAHRYYKIKQSNKKQCLLFKGDTNLSYDEPILGEQVLGRLTRIKRGNKIKDITSLYATVWKRLILSIPFISYSLRLYLNKKEKYQLHVRV